MRFTSIQKRMLILAAAWIATHVSSVQGDGTTIETVALTDLAAPGVPGAVNYSYFVGDPVINDAGQVAFKAFLVGAPVDDTNDYSVFSGYPGNLDLVLREGEPVPGFAPDVVYGGFVSNILIDGNGSLLLRSEIAGPGIEAGENDTGLFSSVEGNLELVILDSDPVPEIGAGVEVLHLGAYSLGENGDIAFMTHLQGAGIHSDNDQAVLKYSNGSFDLVLQNGTQVPDMPMGHEFESLNAAVRINGSGQVVIRPTLNTENSYSIYRDTDGQLESVAVTGHAAPGTPPGVTFDTFYTPSFDQNEANQIAFKARLTDGFANPHGIFSDGAGSLDLIAMTGEIAPDTEPGTVFDDFGVPVINNLGDTAFLAYLSGPSVDDSNYRAVYAQSSGVLKLVARQAEVAPSTMGRIFESFSDLWLSDTGQLVVYAVIDGFSVGDSNNETIYVGNADQLNLIAREGNLFDVDDDPAFDDLRTINALHLSNGASDQTGTNVSLNDAGQLVFRLGFSDGTEGVFIANTPFLLGDVNGDGNVDLLDVQPFVNALSNGVYIPAADINQDGEFNLLDVGPFVNLLAS